LSKFQFVCMVTSQSATSVGLHLEGLPVDLVQNGDTWSGTSGSLDVAQTLNVSFFAKGFQGTTWTLELAIKCPQGDPEKIFSKDGIVPSSGISRLSPVVEIPATPCSTSNS